MAKFDYGAPAELFPSRNRKIRQMLKYRRFDKAADAIRYAMEELPNALLLGAFIEVDETRLGHKDIRDLYESADYPLKKPVMNQASSSPQRTPIPDVPTYFVFAAFFFAARRFFFGGLNTMPSSFMPSGSVKYTA